MISWAVFLLYTTVMDDNKELIKDWAVMFLSYVTICRHFGLTESQMREFGAGDKIVETIRNLETFMLISKARDNKVVE